MKLLILNNFGGKLGIIFFYLFVTIFCLFKNLHLTLIIASGLVPYWHRVWLPCGSESGSPGATGLVDVKLQIWLLLGSWSFSPVAPVLAPWWLLVFLPCGSMYGPFVAPGVSLAILKYSFRETKMFYLYWFVPRSISSF